MKTPQPSPERFTASDLFASGFDLGALRKRINLSIAKAKFKALPKAEQEKLAKQAIETINQLIK